MSTNYNCSTVLLHEYKKSHEHANNYNAHGKARAEAIYLATSQLYSTGQSKFYPKE